MQTVQAQRLVAFPSIGEFRKVIKAVTDGCKFHNLARRPVLDFVGTTKLHGTNAAVVLHRGGEVYAQSRYNVLSEELDNFGFNEFVQSTKREWQRLMEDLLALPEYSNADTIVLYGEWAGGNIHPDIAIAGLPYMFALFKLKTQVAGMVKVDGKEVPGFVSTYHRVTDLKELVRTRIHTSENKYFANTVFATTQFASWAVTIDFNSPKEVQNILADLTNAVEMKCPAGLFFGREGVGEGIVYHIDGDTSGIPFRTDNLMFKVKGQKHSDTNVKTLARVDLEKVKGAREFAEMVATEHRFEKGIDYIKQTHGDPANAVIVKADIGEFIRWVIRDSIKEQGDTMVANALVEKDVMSSIAIMAKTWFLSKY